MYDQDKDAADEHLYGVQDAATYLGIHRATLFRALRNGLIFADHTTPRGRARFHLATLQAFRETLRHQAATSQDHIYAPVRVLAKLASLARSPVPADDSVEAIGETLRLICPPGGSFDMACVALHVPSETDDYAINLLAEFGVPERLRATYGYLRPNEEFPVTTVLRTGVPDFCDDIGKHASSNTTAMRVLALYDITSYAVLPLKTSADASKQTLQPFGALIVCGRRSHAFSPQEKIYLKGVADALSACINHGDLQTSPIHTYDMSVLAPETALKVASQLLETAFAQARCPDARALPAASVVALCDLFAEQSHALATLVYGFSPQVCGDTPDPYRDDELSRQYRSNLHSLVLRTSTADGMKREQWQSKVTAVALPVPLPCGGRGAVGAVWRGMRAEVAAEEVLLSTLASACSLVSE
jgi:hypothetical protein